MKTILDSLCRGRHLSAEQIGSIFDAMVEGSLDPIQISALLVGLRTKGEQPEEIAGAALALRRAAAPFDRPAYRVADTCGTGGDGAETINVSTAVALIAAEMGIPVVKHGNRSISSMCGSADVLERLGVRLDPSAETSRRCLDEEGICFLFAPQYHGGLRHAMPVRRALEVRTIMNLLGPLVNPASPQVQVVGVYDGDLCRPVARTLGMLGCEAALVVHGSGLDEIAVHGPTRAALLSGGDVTELEIHPEEAGLRAHPLEALRGGGPEANAAALRALLSGRGEAAHEAAVAINAGALAWVFGKTRDLRAGTELAVETLRSGGAARRLERFARASHGA